MQAQLDRFTRAIAQRYAVERELATGGTATILLARDVRYQRPVAIKVFRPEYAEAMGHERFRREIALAATLNHPHIVPLLDSGEEAELMYYVMPAIEGESLRDRLTREGRLDLDAALEIAHDVAVALEYAHERSVVHRDVKPENILLTAGTAVVADFGIAKRVSVDDSEKRLTAAGTAVGTVAYMSPEQAAAGPADRRSDIYGLGCVVFEMLSGRVPFTGRSTRAVLVAHLFTAPPSLRSFSPDVAESVERAVTRALAKNPDERFNTVLEFTDALAEARRTASRERIWKEMHGLARPPETSAKDDGRTATQLRIPVADPGSPLPTNAGAPGASVPGAGVPQDDFLAATAAATPATSPAPASHTGSANSAAARQSPAPPPGQPASWMAWLAVGAALVVGMLAWLLLR